MHDIIAGRERISFVAFKDLVESGRLTREDLSVMRSARVIEVPGVGEVFQFLSELDRNLQDFNKIDLKGLKLEEVRILKEKWERTREATWVKVSAIFRKKGTNFLCDSCNTIHPNVQSALNHIETSHPRELGPDVHKNQKIAKVCLSHMCDQSLLFQHVAILDMETKKKHLKSHESNIYERAAELVFVVSLLALAAYDSDSDSNNGEIYLMCT